ncbi:MAG TPA: ChbG/HpnK family deacetylase [Castellaniella sp.]|uniref:ChbG/HpnK family deacetylase n=1 Tax=Castellaniella sp. TaxID=1955812 RepID=UPI002EE64F3A
MDSDSHPTAHEYRRIVLCADDFGMNAAVDAGILRLAQLGRLSATSVLVDGPLAAADAPALTATSLQLGLHLNFTESFGQPDLCRPLRTLIQDAYLRRLPVDEVRSGIQRQLAQFQALCGRLPDYIDGHQHVHQLPVIRQALLAALQSRPGYRPWVRDTSRPRMQGLPLRLKFKARVIASLGAAPLRRLLQRQGYSQNRGFLGVYDFQGDIPAYEGWMRHWLAQCRDGDALMCHPAAGVGQGDALASQRQSEFAVLSGEAFGHLLEEHRLIVAGSDVPQEISK